MKLDTIIIGVLYDHFDRMRKRGRNVAPKLQTTFVLALFAVIMMVMLFIICINVFEIGNGDIPMSEMKFIILFISLLGIIAFAIKKVYFDTERYLEFQEKYNNLIPKRRMSLKITVLSVMCLSPFILLYALYLIRG